jgi:hypothetical protein
LKIFSAWMEEEMDVSVNEAREERGVAEVDDAGVGGVVNGSADGADFVPLDEDLAGLEEGAGVDLKQVRSVEDDGLLGGGERCGECENGSEAEAGFHGYDYNNWWWGVEGDYGDCPSWAKAHDLFCGLIVRAEARTLQSWTREDICLTGAEGVVEDGWRGRGVDGGAIVLR